MKKKIHSRKYIPNKRNVLCSFGHLGALNRKIFSIFGTYTKRLSGKVVALKKKKKVYIYKES